MYPKTFLTKGPYISGRNKTKNYHFFEKKNNKLSNICIKTPLLMVSNYNPKYLVIPVDEMYNDKLNQFKKLFESLENNQQINNLVKDVELKSVFYNYLDNLYMLMNCSPDIGIYDIINTRG